MDIVAQMNIWESPCVTKLRMRRLSVSTSSSKNDQRRFGGLMPNVLTQSVDGTLLTTLLSLHTHAFKLATLF